MNKRLAGIAGLMVIAAIGAALVRYLSPDQVARREIGRYAAEAIGASVHVEAVRIPRAEGTGFITGFSVGNPAGFSTATAIAVASIRMTVDTASLDKEAMVIRTLSVATPHFTYETSQADSNFAKLLANIKPDAGKTGEPARKIIVERLVLHQAKVSYPSPTDRGRMIAVDLPETIRVNNIGRDAGGATPRQFATAVLETLIYHIKRKIPEGALAAPPGREPRKIAGRFPP